MLYTKGEQSHRVGKGLTLLSAGFFSGRCVLCAVWESDWISLLNFDSSFPAARKVNTSNSRIVSRHDREKLPQFKELGHAS